MGGELRRIQVQNLIDNGKLLIGDGYRAKNTELSANGLPFARAGNINNGFHFEDADRFPYERIHRVGSKISQAGDVVFTSKGTVGRFALVRPDTERFVYSPQLCFWRSLDPSFIDPRFLYYWMHSREFYVQYKSVSGQTDMAEYVSLSDQRRMYISLPPLAQQRAIAHILGTLDDKIQLNRRMNETLEAMARALFKSWFVDFDPVRAKAEGRTPSGMDAETAKLFPSEFVDSELGPIPKGWSVGSIYELCTVDYGAPYASAKFNTEKRGLPLVRIRDLTDQTPSVWTDEEHPRAVQLDDGDIVVGMDGEFRAHLWTGGPALLNQRVCRFLPRDPKDRAFVQHALGPCLEFVERTEVATTVIHLGKSDIDRFRILIPSRDVLDSFALAVGPLIEKKIAARHESRNLACIRDTLLPRLLAGVLPVDAAERVVEEVA